MRERVPDTQFNSWFVLSSTAPTGAPGGYRVNATLSGMIVATENVNDGSARRGTVSGLNPSTEYTVTVAAVNSVGSGPFSGGISITTAG